MVEMFVYEIDETDETNETDDSPQFDFNFDYKFN